MENIHWCDFWVWKVRVLALVCNFEICVTKLKCIFSLQLGWGVPKRGKPRVRCSCGLSVLCSQCCHVGISLKRHYFSFLELSSLNYVRLISSAQPLPFTVSNNLMNTTTSYICTRVNSDSVTHRYDVDTLDNGTLPTDKGKAMDKSAEDLSRSASNSPTHSASKASKAFTVRWVSNVRWCHVVWRL